MYSVPRNIKEGLREEHVKILVSSIRAPSDISDDKPLIDGVGTVSSYNWLAENTTDSEIPTIQVPGAPPLVSFPKDTPSLKLNPDSGHQFVNQNAARMNGASGMVPGLAACHAYNQNFKITDYDVVTDRNNLIKLFELVGLAEDKIATEPPVSTPWRAPSIAAAAARRGRSRGGTTIHPFFQDSANSGNRKGIQSMNRRPETLRIDVDVVSGYDNDTGKYFYDDTSDSKTLVLTRWEPVDDEIVVSSVDFRGFGHSFLTKTRQFLSFEDGKIQEKGPKEVTGFHTLVEYKLFGMRVLVRYHADACDMTRAQFVKWITQDGIRDLSELNDSSDDGSQDADGDDNTGYESSETDTFDLLDAFKTLSVKSEGTDGMGDDLPPSLTAASLLAYEYKQSSLPGIPLGIFHTPNIIFPCDQIIQVKTRGRHTGLNREALYTQLFFSQTTKVYVAYHSRGLFLESEAKKEDIASDMSKWADRNKEKFKKLIGLLREVKHRVDELGGKGALAFMLKKKEGEDHVFLDIQARSY